LKEKWVGLMTPEMRRLSEPEDKRSLLKKIVRT
jgi:hypothetical protein